MPTNFKAKMFYFGAIVLSLALFFGAVDVVAAELVVPTDHPTIQGAVDNAAPGDTVIVEDGLYRENVIIKGRVVLRSRNGAEKTIVEPIEPKNDVIKVIDVAGGAAITGFTLKGSLAAGLHIVKSPASKLFRNILTANNYGAHVEYSDGSIIKENLLNVNDTGLYIYFSNDSLIEANEVSLNTNAGILLHSSHNNILLENVTNKNLWNGITLSSSNGNEVRGNKALKNTYAIVVSESSGNLIEGNTTMPRLYYILPVALVYLAIMFYLIERKLFILYYHYKHGE